MSDETIQFRLAGIVTCFQFQKCRCYLQRLHKSFPDVYRKPDIRPMLNLEWNEYLKKGKRKTGGKLWYLKSDCVVFVDDEVLGGDLELLNYLDGKVRISIKQDFYKLGVIQLRDTINRALDSGRKFAYLSFAVESKAIGSMLVLLYADFVPKTVENFLTRCSKRGNGWDNKPVHRIVKRSWIQCGGFDIKPRRMACENYIVPHDRRGVFSTCNALKHRNNSTQFSISLDPTPWMDYKYVAFGQLLQGDEVLKTIENLDTYYESPKREILITSCGEFNLEEHVDEKTIRLVEKFLELKDSQGRLLEVSDPRDVDSELSVTRYKQGLYCLSSDLSTHLLISDYLLRAYRDDIKVCFEEEEHVIGEDQEAEDDETTKEHHQDVKPTLSEKDFRFKDEIYPQDTQDKFHIGDGVPVNRIISDSGNNSEKLAQVHISQLTYPEIELVDFKPLHV